jgi:5'-3' exonuclease-like protein
MKIATFNINNINKRLANLLAWLRRAKRTEPLPRRPLLVIDGDSFAHRSYHALLKDILRKGHRPAGAILGFANLLRGAASRCACRVGHAGGSTYRHEKFPAYQSGREFEDALLEQLRVMPEFVVACGFQNAKAPGFEADDFLAAAAAAEERRGGHVLIASRDRDTFQLASDHTTILYPVRAGQMARIDPAEVRARYGVDPEQVPDFIALRGDPSDKLPGAAVSAHPARQLCCNGTAPSKRRSKRAVSRHKLKVCGFRSLATMNRKAPLPSLRSQKPTWKKAAVLAREWELKQLAGRLEELSLVSSTN